MERSLALFPLLCLLLFGCKGEEPSPELDAPQELAEQDTLDQDAASDQELDAPRDDELDKAALAAFDNNPLPDGHYLPFDFLSFHAHDDDPLAGAARIEALASARAMSAHYQGIELVLSEWGSELDSSAGDPVYNASMEAALHPATVLVLAAHAGLNRAHRSVFWALPSRHGLWPG
ncbi:MAG: hypothetical protein RBU37_08820 [Myxococcota bacterium]|jgi:hypothetical protein|nr:hypothetical protein [Myxococcota bacterium]